jgi:hypothetical protein
MHCTKLFALVAIMASSGLAAPSDSGWNWGFPPSKSFDQKVACGNGVEPFCCNNAGDYGDASCSNMSKTFSSSIKPVTTII